MARTVLQQEGALCGEGREQERAGQGEWLVGTQSEFELSHGKEALCGSGP